MRYLVPGLMLSTLIACSGATQSPHPLDGVWKLESASPGVPPRTMTLRQFGATVSGTASAMGVDRDIQINVSGSFSSATAVSPPLVDLIFTFENGGGMTAQFTGTLQDGDPIDGSVIYYGITNVPQSGTLDFTR